MGGEVLDCSVTGEAVRLLETHGLKMLSVDRVRTGHWGEALAMPNLRTSGVGGALLWAAGDVG